MADDVVFDYNGISESADAMGSRLAMIQQELTELQETVNRLLENGLVFEEASPALQASYKSFNDQMTKSAAMIGEYADTFTKLGEDMKSADQAMALEIDEARLKAEAEAAENEN